MDSPFLNSYLADKDKIDITGKMDKYGNTAIVEWLLR